MDSEKARKGLLAAGAVAIAAFGLYYLLKSKTVKIGRKHYSAEDLKRIIRVLEAEDSNFYLHFYIVMKEEEAKIKQLKDNPVEVYAIEEDFMMQKIKGKLAVFKKLGIKDRTYEKMCESFDTLPELQDYRTNSEENQKRIMKFEKPIYNFKIPEEITPEILLKLYSFSHAKFSFDIYQKVVEYWKSALDPLSNELMALFCSQCNLFDIEEEVYRRLGLPIVDDESPIYTIKRANFMFCMEDPDFLTKYQNLQLSQTNFLNECKNGSEFEGMEEDPLLVMERGDDVPVHKPRDYLKKCEERKEGAPKKGFGAFADEEIRKKFGGDVMRRQKK